MASQALGTLLTQLQRGKLRHRENFMQRQPRTAPGPCCHPCPQPGVPQSRAALLTDLQHCVPRFNQPLTAEPPAPAHIKFPAVPATSLGSPGMNQRVLGCSSQQQGWGLFYPSYPLGPDLQLCREEEQGWKTKWVFSSVQNLAKSHPDGKSIWTHCASAWVL